MASKKIFSDRLVKSIQEELLKMNVKITKKDIITCLLCRLNDNYKPMFETRLYKNRGGDYCRLLQVTNWLFNNDDFTKRQLENVI